MKLMKLMRGGGEVFESYKEESCRLEMNKDDNLSVTMFTYSENANFSGFWFYDDGNDNSSYAVNENGEIISNNSVNFNLESGTFVRRINLNKGEIGETQNDKNDKRIVYINNDIVKTSIGEILLLYKTDTLEIVKCNNKEENWVGKYYIEFVNSENKKIQSIVDLNLNNITYSNDSNYDIDKINNINFNIKKGNDIVYAYRSRNISNSEFLDKKALISIHLTRNVTKIGYAAFRGCTNLKQITIPNSVTEIGINAFYGCTNLEKMLIPDSVTSIGTSAFYGCTNLQEVTISNNVEKINDNVFQECTNLEKVTIPDNVTSIGSGAFRDCEELEQVTIPNNVREIGTSAFSDCTNLQEVIIFDGITSISSNLFYGCIKLEKVTIPDSVIEIGTSAFQSCIILEEVTIPDSVTKISANIFNYCTGLNKVIIEGNLEEIGSNAFNTYSEQTLEIQCNQTTCNVISSKVQDDGYANRITFNIVE